VGRLTFGEGIRVDFDDRALAHLYRAMLGKLHKGEGFHLSWKDDISIGDGRMTVWVHPDTSMVCKLGRPVGDVNPAWLSALSVAANSVEGLHLVPEPLVPAPARV